MKIKSQEAAAQVLGEMKSSLRALKKEQSQLALLGVPNYVLSFENGLALKVHGPHQVHVCGIIYASQYMSAMHARKAPGGPVRNGHGEEAKPILWSEALAKEIVRVEALIAEIEAAEVIAA